MSLFRGPSELPLSPTARIAALLWLRDTSTFLKRATISGKQSAAPRGRFRN